MSTANKIFSNTLWQVILRAISILIGVLNLSLITRILGTTSFGFYTTIFAFAQTFMILADLGLYLTLLREISTAEKAEQESKIVNNIFTIRFFASLIVLVLAPIAIIFFPYAPEVKTNLIYFILTFFLQSLVSTLAAVFAKKLAMPLVAIADLLNKSVYCFILFYLFFNTGSFRSVLAWHSFTQALGVILLIIFLRKFVKLHFAFDFSYWRKVFITTWPLALTTVLNLVYFKADTLVLSAYAPAEVVGLYGAPYRVLEVLATFPHMFMSLIVPLFTAHYLQKNWEQLQILSQHVFDFFVILSGLILVNIWLVSKPLMILLAGRDYAGSGPLLNILIIATVAIYFGTFFSYLVVAINKQKEMVKYFFIAAIVGLSTYFIFIPKYGAPAAAWLTVLVELLLWFFAYLVIKKHLPLKFFSPVFFKTVLASCLAFILGKFVFSYSFILSIIVASLVYVIVLYVTRGISKELLKKILTKTD